MRQQLSNFGIGASEISAVCGLNPFASPWSIWVRKVEGLADEPSDLMEWGNRLEPAIRQKYVDKTGALVLVPKDSMFHAENTWARATPDGIGIKGGLGCDADELSAEKLRDKWTHLLQCKNVGEWPGKAWNGEPPNYVQLQEQWELYVTGLERADVAALIGGNDFRIYTVHRDDKIITDMVTIAFEFWGRVLTKTPPKIDDSDACADHLKRRLAKSDSVELEADEEIERLMSEWHDLHRESKRAEKRIKTIRNLLMSELADAKADRVSSASGTAKIRRTASRLQPEVDWKLIAELIGTTRTTADEWQSLVSANTSQRRVGNDSVTLYAPHEWSQEHE